MGAHRAPAGHARQSRRDESVVLSVPERELGPTWADDSAPADVQPHAAVVPAPVALCDEATRPAAAQIRVHTRAPPAVPSPGTIVGTPTHTDERLVATAVPAPVTLCDEATRPAATDERPPDARVPAAATRAGSTVVIGPPSTADVQSHAAVVSAPVALCDEATRWSATQERVSPSVEPAAESTHSGTVPTAAAVVELARNVPPSGRCPGDAAAESKADRPSTDRSDEVSPRHILCSLHISRAGLLPPH